MELKKTLSHKAKLFSASFWSLLIFFACFAWQTLAMLFLSGVFDISSHLVLFTIISSAWWTLRKHNTQTVEEKNLQEINLYTGMMQIMIPRISEQPSKRKLFTVSLYFSITSRSSAHNCTLFFVRMPVENIARRGFRRTWIRSANGSRRGPARYLRMLVNSAGFSPVRKERIVFTPLSRGNTRRATFRRWPNDACGDSPLLKYDIRMPSCRSQA